MIEFQVYFFRFHKFPPPPVLQSTGSPSNHADTMTKSQYRTPFAYFDLIETFAKPKDGCAVCTLVQRDVQQYIDNVLFEFANEPGLRATFSAGRGVCIEHGLMLKNNKIGNVIGIARMYGEALDELLIILDGAASTPSAPARGLFNRPKPSADAAALADQLEPREDCIACAKLVEFEGVYIDMFNRYLSDERFVTALRGSPGVCLPHLRLILRRLESADHAQTLVAIQRDIWRSLRAEITVFHDKQNYEMIDGGQKIGAEGDSWIRAILRFAGERGVFGLRRK